MVIFWSSSRLALASLSGSPDLAPGLEGLALGLGPGALICRAEGIDLLGVHTWHFRLARQIRIAQCFVAFHQCLLCVAACNLAMHR